MRPLRYLNGRTLSPVPAEARQRRNRQAYRACRRKMRMSGLCKVEMSAFLGAGRPNGTGADQLECERAGAIEGAARNRARSSEAGGSRPTLAVDGPAGAAVMDTLAYPRRWRAGSPAAGTSLESENP